MKQLQKFSTLEHVKVLKDETIAKIKGGRKLKRDACIGHGCPPPIGMSNPNREAFRLSNN